MLALLVCAAAILLALGVAACGGDEQGAEEPQGLLAEIQERGYITNGVNPEFAPFEFVDESGDIVGFDIDLANELGKQLGVEVRTQDFAFDGLIPALAGRKVDMVFSALTITPERAKSVAFSDPYFEATLCVVVAADETEITGPDDLPGKKVGVQIGTTGDIVATEQMEGVEVARFQQLAAPFLELQKGGVDAVIIDTPYAELYIAKNPGFKIVGDKFNTEEYGVCVHLEDEDLLAAINDGLAEIKASGKYDEILAKWFGSE